MKVIDRIIYCDNNATTRIAPEVFEGMKPFLTEFYGNPSSIHNFGGQVQKAIDEARASVAELLGAQESEIVFTSGGTESDNAAIFSAVRVKEPRKKVLISKLEHPAVLNLGKELFRRGYNVLEIPVDNSGRVDMDFIEDNVDSDTALVSVMWANNEIGNIYPVDEISRIAHSQGALFHTDAVQAVGKVPIDLSRMTIDTLALSGHKLHAPKGVGVLYIKRGVRFKPYLIGGHQERGRRAGTENVASIVGLGIACKLAIKNMKEENTRVKELRDKLEDSLLSSIQCTRLNGDKENRIPNTTNISFEYIEGEAILLMMNQMGICASSGSACTSGSLEPSHVLRAIGVPYTAAHGSVRFSLSVYNTADEIDFIIEKLPPIIDMLREISPYWRKRHHLQKV
ncbi:MAG TPA: cysteine desulfurase NifS [Victivallales bacterium]|nr:cysteine desulfurase NifS [Victivallales bacterium]HPO89761.1 cysteine desulfurase NifS [Victivallales bacterium]HRR28135.1 cysteine desulfurase NifS [Victivallales bacterium]HRU00300.1 cysteine desulfurase NifS [Victivallales bacterium]